MFFVLSNGTAHLAEEEPQDVAAQEEPEAPVVAQEEEPEAVIEGQPEAEEDQLEFGKIEEEEKEVKGGGEGAQEVAGEQPAPSASTTSSTEPPKAFSWAAMISKGSSSSAPAVAAAPAPKPTAPMKSSPPGGDGSSSGPQPQRSHRPSRGERTPRDNNSNRGNQMSMPQSTGGGGGGGPSSSMEEDPRRPRYPDSHQLFVGNLPHSILEKELKQFFEGEWTECSGFMSVLRPSSDAMWFITGFGPVVEVRIKGKGTRDVPNFSFVVFDNADAVQAVLSARVSIWFPFSRE